jgi:hypothetical protein
VINRHAPSILLVSVTGLLFSYGSSAWSWVAGPVAALGLWGLGRKVREPAPAPKRARRRSQLAPVDQEL